MNIMSPEIMSAIVGIIVLCIFIYFLWFRSPYKKATNIKPSFVSAFAKYFDGDTKSALEEMKAIALDNKVTPELYLTIGYLYRNMGEYNKAAQTHELLINMKEIDATFRSALITELAKDYLYAHMPNKSLQILQNYPDALYNPSNLYIAALAALRVHDYDKAITYSEKYEKISKNKMHGFFPKVMITKAMHSTDKSKVNKCIAKAISYASSSRAGRFIKADMMIGVEKEKKTAIEFIKLIKENQIRDMKDMKTIKDAFIKIGCEKDLNDFLREQIELRTANPYVYILRAEYLIDNNEKEKAEDIMEKYINTKDAKLIAFKYYAELKKDSIIKKLLIDKMYYKCRICGSEFTEYHDDCTTCRSTDTIVLK